MIEGGDIPKYCASCGDPLTGYDHRWRIMIMYGGEKRHVYVLRLECRRCDSVSTALPEQMSPHKHYASEVIENVIDEVCTPVDIQTEDYPCEKTMDNWKAEFESKKVQIDGQLKSILSGTADQGKKLLESGISLLEKLRNEGAGWLSAVNRIIYNAGGFLKAGVNPPDFSCVIPEDSLSSDKRKDKSDEERRNSQMAGRRSTEQVSDDSSTDRKRCRSG